MAKMKTDLYANRAYQTLTMSAANTITFQQMRFAVGTFQGVGLLLHRLKYWPSTTSVREMVAATDHMAMGLTLRDDLTTLDPTNQAVLDCKQVTGIAANVEPFYLPLTTDWTVLPGGGLLIPANPVYIGMTTAGAVAASEVRVLMEYTFLELSDREAIELLQTIIPGNV